MCTLIHFFFQLGTSSKNSAVAEIWLLHFRPFTLLHYCGIGNHQVLHQWSKVHSVFFTTHTYTHTHTPNSFFSFFLLFFTLFFLFSSPCSPSCFFSPPPPRKNICELLDQTLKPLPRCDKYLSVWGDSCE